MIDTKELYTLDEKECARRLNLSQMTIARLRKLQKIGHFRVGRRVLYGDSHIRKFLQDCSQDART